MPEHKNKKLIIFDLDGTLTKSKSPIDSEMAELVTKLLAKIKVAVISGGGYPQFETQFIKMLPVASQNYSNLLLLPTSGTRLFSWKGQWKEEYAENLSKIEREKIMAALEAVLHSEYVRPAVTYGDIIEDRGSQITFSALGQKAPVEAKYAWDPTREKRERIASALQKKIQGFDVRIGGATSVDITKRGVNKGYGIRKLEKFLNIAADEITFVGDTLFYGGNDYPARATGVDCVPVKGPEETKEFIKKILLI
ncbi:MAG: HAD-IIB family hydrolase [Candidatus Paceibacterota bacterium]|jgi:hypothetical protein